MQARAGAVDELLASGALDDVTAGPGSGGDDIQRELDAISAGSDVEPSWPSSRARSGRRAPAAIASATRPRPTQPPRRRAAGCAAGRGAVVIVRILGEGQYDVPDNALDELETLDVALRRRRGR